MAIPVQCSNCHAAFKVRDELAGKRAKCPKCGNVFQIPSGNPAPAGGPPQGAAKKRSIDTSAFQPAPVRPAPVMPADPTAPMPVQPAQYAPGGEYPQAAAAPVFPQSQPFVTTDEESSPVARRRKKQEIPVWVWGIVTLLFLGGGVGYAVWYNQNAERLALEKHEAEVAEKRAQAERERNARFETARAAPLSTGREKTEIVAKPTENASLEDIVQYAQQGIVLIETSNSYQRTGLGSGVIIEKTPDRVLVATNYHVVREALKADVVFHDGVRYGIEGYLAVEPDYDLAIVKLNGVTETMQALDLNGSDDVRQAASVYSIGHPQGHKFQVTDGIISAIQTTSDLPEESKYWVQENFGVKRNQKWITHTAQIAPGNSGGPLLDSAGRIIGINTWVNRDANLSFAISSTYLATMLNNLFSEVHRLSEHYSPAANEPLVVDNNLISAILEKVEEMKWAPNGAEQYLMLQALGELSIAVADQSSIAELTASLGKVSWYPGQIRTVNQFAGEVLESEGGIVFVGTVKTIAESPGQTHLLIEVAEDQVAYVLLPYIDKEIKHDDQVAVLGVCTGNDKKLGGDSGVEVYSQVMVSVKK